MADQFPPSWDPQAAFLGSKAENADVLISLIETALQDYVHWRKNYFPEDPRTLSTSRRRANEQFNDRVESELHDLLARLRRNFPFYSPRYIAHQLSDTTIVSVVGYIAGMLYNPNNVTPEAAPVTTELEVEAMNEILRMIGFDLPPEPRKDDEPIEAFHRRAKSEFGWAHITSGGTTANIEALWVARVVKLFPLAIQDVARTHDLPLVVRLSDGSSCKITEGAPESLMHIKPNESIFLLGKLAEQLRDKKAPGDVWHELKRSKVNPTDSVATVLGTITSRKREGGGRARTPQLSIFVSGAAHYSIAKAADVLGLGRKNIEIVEMDSMFRMDVNDLATKLNNCIRKGNYPLAVVAILGTTEEGSCDPIHEILRVREEFQREHGVSFWVHVDAAWGGFIRSLFNFGAQDELACTYRSFLRCAGMAGPLQNPANVLREVVQGLGQHTDDDNGKAESPPPEEGAPLAAAHAETANNELRRDVSEPESVTQPDGENLAGESIAANSVGDRPSFDATPAAKRGGNGADSTEKSSNQQEESHKAFSDVLRTCEVLEDHGQFDAANTLLGKHKNAYSILLKLADVPRVSLEDRMNHVTASVSRTIERGPGSPSRVELQWGDYAVLRSFFALPSVDSVTIDAHKMGYVPYPNGAVAYKNDRIRSLIAQRAPYITSMGSESINHIPIKHSEHRSPQALAPYILEGSRPGAAAAALWLTSQVIPLDLRGHGQIVRSSLLAARELYEIISRWEGRCRMEHRNLGYRLVPLTSAYPDTNIVCFVVQEAGNAHSLERMNQLTEAVYNAFSIETELGPTQHSYAQHFFLSKTSMESPYYSWPAVEDFLTNEKRCHLDKSIKKQYDTGRVVVLRATVMSPYYDPPLAGWSPVFEEFVSRLHKESESALSVLKSVNS